MTLSGLTVQSCKPTRLPEVARRGFGERKDVLPGAEWVLLAVEKSNESPSGVLFLSIDQPRNGRQRYYSSNSLTTEPRNPVLAACYQKGLELMLSTRFGKNAICFLRIKSAIFFLVLMSAFVLLFG